MSLLTVYLHLGVVLTFCVVYVYTIECPDAFVSHQGVCYKEFGILANWNEAKTYCEAYGADLATVANDRDQTFLSGYLQRLSSSYFNSGIFWLGGSDQASEGTWIWDKSQQQITYTKWKTGEPNNAGKGENCLTMSFSDNFLWNDNNCAHKYNFICEVRSSDFSTVVG
ncbi:hypothetical protein ACF0H5_009549 [Mactra antiquata]